MAEQEKFEVGQWVWVWSERQWLKILTVNPSRNEVGFEDRGFTHFINCTANPVIPPRPKKMVTKEATYCRMDWRPFMEADVVELVFRIPVRDTSPDLSKPKNIHCTYDIEEPA